MGSAYGLSESRKLSLIYNAPIFKTLRFIIFTEYITLNRHKNYVNQHNIEENESLLIH